MDSAITVRTLTDGGQSALDVARSVAQFVGDARETLDLAQYDFNLAPETAAVVASAIKAAAARGVAVRFVYNVDHRAPIPVPPPPEPDAALIASLGVPAKPVAGVPDLMHHKYVVRDGEVVWTGSANWTDDSWSRQENVIATVASRELAHAFELNFEEMWSGAPVEETGAVEPRPVRVGGIEVRPWFTPRYGEDLSHRMAKMIGRAKRRVRIASPIITSAPVLGTVAQAASDHRVDLAGVVDLTQVREVLYQWHANGNASWKIPLLETSLTRAPFSGKSSTPWNPTSTHDFMHAKVTVADDEVFVGSFNLSHSGERNAENVLEIRGRYPLVTPDALGSVRGLDR